MRNLYWLSEEQMRRYRQNKHAWSGQGGFLVCVNGNMRTDAIVNFWSTTRTALYSPFVETKDNQRHPGPLLQSMGPYMSQATTEATKSALDSF